MDEVSCRATLVCLEQLDQLGIPRARLVEGLPVELAHLERTRSRLSWDVYVDVMERFEALVGGAVALEQTGEMSTGTGAFQFFHRIARLTTEPAWVYRFVFQFFGPAMFSNVRNTMEEVAPRRYRFTLEIPPTYRDCPAFFRISAGAFRTSPTVFGYPRADVVMQLTPRRAVYDVTVPDGGTAPRTRVREWVARSLWAKESLDVLRELQDELRGGYHGLQEANQRIQEQKQLLERAMEEQRRVEQENRHLERQLHRAQKLEGLGLLAGGIAHDFNNLLTVIVANLELAQAGMPHAEGEVLGYLEGIREAATRAGDLTRQLLAYAGRRPPTLRAFDLGALVGNVGNLLRAAFPRHVALIFHGSEGLPPVHGDPAQLQQVIMNLITNAAEAAHGERGTITLRTGVTKVDEARRLRANLGEGAAPGDYVFFEVADDGVGMDDEVLGRIFDPFFSTKGEGRGLGLSAILGIIRGHRGLLEVETRAGAGSLFRVLLPLRRGEDSRVAPSPSTKATPGGGWRGRGVVLVVDDEELVRESVARMLERLGFEVRTATDGADAVDRVRAHEGSWAAILLDLSMPRMGGEQAFRAIRALRPDARVVLCSGNLDDRVVQDLLGEGLAGVLPKPFRAQELATLLQRVLDVGVASGSPR
ncbi:MAG: response regulator [Myxococcota bacterium]